METPFGLLMQSAEKNSLAFNKISETQAEFLFQSNRGDYPILVNVNWLEPFMVFESPVIQGDAEHPDNPIFRVLLQLAAEVDLVKLCYLKEDNVVYARCEIHAVACTEDFMNFALNQVAAVSEQALDSVMAYLNPEVPIANMASSPPLEQQSPLESQPQAQMPPATNPPTDPPPSRSTGMAKASSLIYSKIIKNLGE